MLLTKTSTFIIGPVATLLGYIMNAIFWVQSQIGIENLHVAAPAHDQAAEIFQAAEQDES